MTAIANERLLNTERGQQLVGQVEKTRRGEASGQAHAYVEVAVSGGAARDRLHDLSILSILVVAQLTWVGALGYGIYMLA